MLTESTPRRTTIVIAMVLALFLAIGALPAQARGGGSIDHFTELPIADTENPCGSAVGSATGWGVEHVRGGTTTTFFAGRFDVELTGDPIANAWDESANRLRGFLVLKTVETATGFNLFLRVWGRTDTGVRGRFVQKLSVGPEGGAMSWNCYDGQGPQHVEF